MFARKQFVYSGPEFDLRGAGVGLAGGVRAMTKTDLLLAMRQAAQLAAESGGMSILWSLVNLAGVRLRQNGRSQEANCSGHTLADERFYPFEGNR
jgi:hypothetical protein